jgi:hypothetical protein
MMQTLFVFFPSQMGGFAVFVAVVGALFGATLWLCGSRYNRTILTLLALSLGTILGLQLPQWFGWKIDRWATGMLACLIFGATGYAWNKAWVGIGLGMVLACWAAVATFAVYGFGPVVPGGPAWLMPVFKPGMTAGAWTLDFWNSLATQTRHLLPFAIAAGLLTGIGAAVAWPRFGTVLLYSTLGVSLLIALGTAVVLSTHPAWLGIVPNTVSSQAVVLGSLVAFGVIFQWRANPARAAGGDRHDGHGGHDDEHVHTNEGHAKPNTGYKKIGPRHQVGRPQFD